MSSTSPEEAPASENDISGQQPATSAGSSVHNLTNQLSFTMSSVSEAMGRQWGQLSQRSQTIDLGIIPDSSLHSSDYPGKSLLHEKLFEKNEALKKSVDKFVESHVAEVPRQVGQIVESTSKTTQTYFQDSVLSMQQANHFCAESLESMDDFMEIANRQQWPV